jgi:hypothetical protein
MQKKIWKREIIQLIRGLFKIGRTQSKLNALNKKKIKRKYLNQKNFISLSKYFLELLRNKYKSILKIIDY